MNRSVVHRREGDERFYYAQSDSRGSDSPPPQARQDRFAFKAGFWSSLGTSSVERNATTEGNGSTKGEEGGDVDMMALENVGLYMHYFASGLMYGVVSRASIPTCTNYYRAEAAYCRSMANTIIVPWSLKVFYTIATDIWWPFDIRRKVYMIFGWGALIS